MKRRFVNETLDGLNGKARVVIPGPGVRLREKAMYENSGLIQESERTVTYAWTTCANAMIYIQYAHTTDGQHDGSSQSLTSGYSRRKDKQIYFIVLRLYG